MQGIVLRRTKRRQTVYKWLRPDNPGFLRLFLVGGIIFPVAPQRSSCDIIAVREDEEPLLAIVEMKRRFNLDLLLQAVDRMRPAGEVWLAVPMTRRGRDHEGVCGGSAGSSVSG